MTCEQIEVVILFGVMGLLLLGTGLWLSRIRVAFKLIGGCAGFLLAFLLCFWAAGVNSCG